MWVAHSLPDPGRVWFRLTAPPSVGTVLAEGPRFAVLRVSAK